MRGNEFIKRVQKYAKTHGLVCDWHPERGKGSHGSLILGDRFTVVRNPKDELKTGTLHAMLKQLNLKLSDLIEVIAMSKHSAVTVARRITSFSYPAKFTADEGGGYVVTFRDVPEAITQGDTIEECREQAGGALQAAIETYIERRMAIPAPSEKKRGEHMITLATRTALKAAVHLGMIERHMTNVALARIMHVNEKEVRRMLDPNHPTKADTLEQALAALGKKVEIRVH